MRQAYNTALKWLNNRALTSKEIERKLKDKKFDEDTITEVIKKLKEYNFINDELYAANYVKYAQNLKKKGKFYIIKKLIEKGVDRTIIDNIFSEYKSEDEFKTAKEAVEKKFKNKARDEKTALRINSFLRSRGFSDDVIYSIIKEYKEGNGD